MRYAIAGIKMVFTDRQMWPYVFKPLILGAVVYVLIVILGFAVVFPAFGHLADSLGARGDSMGWLRTSSSWLGAAIFALLLWFLSGIIFLAITSLFSAFLWEKLSMEVEERIGIDPVTFKHTFTTLAVDSAIRVFLAILVAIFSILTGWLCFGVLGILAAGWLGLYDYTCPAYLRRNQPIWAQAFEVYRLKGWFSFVLFGGVFTLIPFLNVLFLPGLVAGGTLLRAQITPNRRAL